MSELAIRQGAAPALAVEGLSDAYPHAPRPALVDVSLEVAPGEFVLLAGRSASGKSTLLKAACGLVPHFHGGEIEGEVRVADLDAIATGPGELAAVVGYLAQDPETQVVSTTVAAEIELPLEMRGDAPADRARAVEEVALALAIPHLLGRTVDTLSGGELQRVALAAALVTRPRLILLDEPTSQLDPVAGDELIWLLRRLNEEWGVAVLLAEHRLERCLAAADRVVAMEAGGIPFDGAPAEFLSWTAADDPALTTPAARMFSLAGIEPLPVGVRAARQTLRSRGIE
ncbi:MAG TPA: ABC transporter ATP-binding protein [Solirubrobacterales bacterium]